MRVNYRIGMVLDGKVTGIQPYGAFVALDDKTQGLIHISECRHGFIDDIRSYLKVGQRVSRYAAVEEFVVPFRVFRLIVCCAQKHITVAVDVVHVPVCAFVRWFCAPSALSPTTVGDAVTDEQYAFTTCVEAE